MAEQGKGTQLNTDKLKANKRSAEAIEGLSAASPNKVPKTSNSNPVSQLKPYPGIDEGISISQLTVGQLNTLMWYNFQQMQSQTLFAALSNLETMVKKKVGEEISRVETDLNNKIKNAKVDLDKRLKVVQVSQLEADIDMASMKQFIDELKNKSANYEESKVDKPHSVIIKNLDMAEDEFTSDIGLEVDVSIM